MFHNRGGEKSPPLFMPKINNKHCCRLSCLFFLLILLCYSNTLFVPWQLDDPPNITNNPLLRINNLMPETLWQTLHAKPFDPGALYRPVANLSFALNWYVGQDNTLGYHVVNLLIHILTALLLYQTIFLLFQTPNLGRYSGKDAYFIALLSTVLWAINPIQIQAVTYIVQRMASMAAMFYIWALFWYIKFRLSETIPNRRLNFLLCVLCYILAVGSKENAAILPLSILTVEFIFFPKTADKFSKNTRRILIGLSCAIGLFSIYYIIHHGYLAYLFKPIGSRPYTLYERLLTEPGIVLFYLSLIFYPLAQRFSVDHDISIAGSLFSSWTTLASILTIVILILFALAQIRKRPILSFAILFFFINHLIESTIIPLELIFEHRNYLPSMFLFMPVAAGILYLLKFYSKRNRVIHAAIILFIPLLLITTGWNTYLRNSVWASEKSLWLDAVQKAPNTARAYAKLGELAGWNPDKTPEQLALAIGYYQKALSSYSPRTSFKAAILGNMGEVFFMYGLYDKAIEYYTKSLALNPHFNNSQYGMAKALVMQGKFEQALQVVAQALNENHAQSRFLNIGGLILLRLNKPEEALWSFQQAMKINRNKQQYFFNLGVALSKAGHYTNAEWFLRRSFKKSPNDIKILFSLLENSVRAADQQQSDYYAQKIIQQFSLTTIEYYLENLKNDYRTVPIATTLIAPVLHRHLQQQIQRVTTQPEN